MAHADCDDGFETKYGYGFENCSARRLNGALS